jgi:hypothetical protein
MEPGSEQKSFIGGRAGASVAAVGMLVGVLVGASVGMLVGVLVGVPVGMLVGMLVGIPVGDDVGVPVGCMLGASVPASLRAPDALSWLQPARPETKQRTEKTSRRHIGDRKEPEKFALVGRRGPNPASCDLKD